MWQEEPNAYVKVYLHPDPSKQTKRKTKVVKKSCNPIFMEMLEYRIPIKYARYGTRIPCDETLIINKISG
jgi:phosphatidylinositol-4-phosphate 3-kinase